MLDALTPAYSFYGLDLSLDSLRVQRDYKDPSIPTHPPSPFSQQIVPVSWTGLSVD